MNAIRLKEKKRLPLWFRILTDLLIVALISGVFAVYYLLLPKKAESMGTLEGLDQVRSFALPADPLATDLPERLSAVLGIQGRRRRTTGACRLRRRRKGAVAHPL